MTEYPRVPCSQEVFHEQVDRDISALAERGLVEQEGENLRLTEEGLAYIDDILRPIVQGSFELFREFIIVNGVTDETPSSEIAEGFLEWLVQQWDNYGIEFDE